ncbi:MAG: NAD(P)-dependent glycerol-3-phosphate dehydrogenase [Bdellovibrionales bacterium]|nr:NAD(P)-dependent glycerol-3-phosphate dehydrogenase [Bdellovibrionales bacterium]
MPDIAVIGLGNWGTALANHLAMKGLNVLAWSIDEGVADSINNQHINPLFQSEILLDSKLRATENLDEVLNCEYVLLVLPSKALSEIIPKLNLQSNTCLISAVKGLEIESKSTPLSYADQYLPNKCKLAVISGPSFAIDLVSGKPVSVVAASNDEITANQVAKLFSNEWLKAYISTDVIGVELGGILKNIIAVAAGVADGMGLGESARAAVITRGLAEMTKLGVALGAQKETFFGLSGLGDLVLTASCDTSRNRTVGLRLGAGEKADHIVKTLGSVAEGLRTAPIVLEIAKEKGIEVPITEQVNLLIQGRVSPEDMVKNLVTRPLKKEF